MYQVKTYLRMMALRIVTKVKLLNLAVFFLVLFAATGTFYFVISQYNSSLKLDNASIKSSQGDFKTTDRLMFTLNLGSDAKLPGILEAVRAGENGVFYDGDVTIKPKIIETNRNQKINLPLEILKQSNTSYLISAKPPGDFLAPGGYKLLVEVERAGNVKTFEQDFTWGVLAINTNKSLFQPNETAKITMAVLNKEGDMVCNAQVELVVTDPQGDSQKLSTADETIKINDGCRKKAFIWEPDYEALFEIGSETGTYIMNLEATTATGTHKIKDTFEVKESVPFDVERITATRIYPRERYPVILKIIANKNFTGKIKEVVPRDFKIFKLSKYDAQKFTEERMVSNYFSGFYSPPHEELDPNALYREITLQVNLEKGKTYYLGYWYDAPDKSPNFFKLGPVALVDAGPSLVFQEARIWQIAVDFAYSIPHASVFTDVDDTGTNTTLGVYEDVNNTTLSQATLNSAGFGDTEQVLLIVDVNFDGNSYSSVYGVRVANTAGTAVPNTEHRREIRTASDRQEIFRFITRTTKTSGAGFVLQKAFFTATFTRPDVNKVSIIALGLGDLEDGVEYVYDEDLSTSAIPANGSPATYATLTTPSGMPAWQGDILVLDHWKVNMGSSWTDTDSIMHDLQQDSGTPVNETRMEAEDAQDIYGGGSIYVFNQADTNSHTYNVRMENSDATTNAFDHEYSAIIAFPANLFEDFEFNSIDAEYNTINTSFNEMAGITPFSPQNTGDFLILGQAIAQGDGSTGNKDDMRIRIQVDGTNAPTGYVDTPEGTMLEDHNDDYPLNWASLENFDTTSKNIDLDAATDNTNGDFYYRTLVALSMGTTNVDISGTLYTDDDEATAIASTSVCTTIDTGFNTNNCATTDGSGDFTITDVFAGTGGENITLFVDGGSTFGNVVTIGDGTDMSINVYENHVIARYEQGTSLTIADMDEYDQDQNAVDFLFDATDAAPDTLVWDSGTAAVIGEVGQATTDYQGTNIQFRSTYTSPIVIAESISGDDTGTSANRPAAAMITFIDGTGFNVRIQETDSESDDHGEETFGWMVMEEGTYTLENGTLVEADKQTLATTNYWNGGTAFDCNYTQSFSAAPIVMGSLQTNNNTGTPDFFTAMITTNTSVDFDCFIGMEDGGSGTPSSGEDFGWIAIESGTGTVNNIDYEAGDAGTNINGWTEVWYNQSFTQSFSSAPILLAQRYTGNGGDEGWMRYDDLTSSSVDLAIDENDDSDRSHGTTDASYYLAFSKAGEFITYSGTPTELYIPSSYTFAPGGNSNGHDIEIDGTWTAASGETIDIDGTFKLDTGGALNPSTSTLTFDAAQGYEDLITDGTGDLYNLTINDSAGSLTVEVEDPLVVQNNLTITGGTLDVVSSENNQITLHGNWNNDDGFEARDGLVLFDGSGASTYTIDADGPGSLDAFYDITFNDAAGGATYQITTVLEVDDDLTITGGTMDSNGFDIYVGGNWTNNDIFLEGTRTVYLDSGKSATLDTGCTDADTCTSQNFYNLTINKGSGGDIVTLSPDELRVTNTFTITSGEFVQTTDDVRLEGTTALQLYDFGRYTNLSTGNLTLGGNVVNDYGAITFNANGAACGDADSITIASTNTTPRSWSGNGAFRITDVNVSYQTGSATIKAASSNDGGNNGSNWLFIACSIFEFSGLNLEGLEVN